MIPAGHVTAQTFRVFHHFAGSPGDGANPHAGLNSSGNILYGTTEGGGSLGIGTVFALDADGTGFTTMHSFIGSIPTRFISTTRFFRSTASRMKSG